MAKYHLNKIDIKDLGDTVTVAIMQLESPFDKELGLIGRGVNQVIDVITKDIYEKRKNRIKRLLDDLLEKCKNDSRKINIVIFPEYSIPIDILDFIKHGF